MAKKQTYEEMNKKNKCRKCKHMLTCLMYSIGQENLCPKNK